EAEEPRAEPDAASKPVRLMPPVTGFATQSQVPSTGDAGKSEPALDKTAGDDKEGKDAGEDTAEEETKPAFQLRGRIHADAVIVNQSTRNRAIIGDVQDATGFRRARLGAQGYVGEQVNWVAEFDFAG